MSAPEPRRDGPRGAVAPPSGERLFRRRALERYARRGEESVLPRLARPPAFAALWALVALLAILAGVVGALPVADERTVSLVITADGPRLVLPEEAVSTGDPVRYGLAGASFQGRVGTVGEATSPAELGPRLGVVGLDLTGLALDGPRRIATIDPPADLDLDDARGAVVEARVTVDRPRMATLLPGVGPWIARWITRWIDDPGPGEEASP